MPEMQDHKSKTADHLISDNHVTKELVQVTWTRPAFDGRPASGMGSPAERGRAIAHENEDYLIGYIPCYSTSVLLPLW